MTSEYMGMLRYVQWVALQICKSCSYGHFNTCLFVCCVLQRHFLSLILPWISDWRSKQETRRNKEKPLATFNFQEGGDIIKSRKRISLIFFQNHSDELPAQPVLPKCICLYEARIRWAGRCDDGAALRRMYVKTTVVTYQHNYTYLTGARCECVCQLKSLYNLLFCKVHIQIRTWIMIQGSQTYQQDVDLLSSEIITSV